MAQHNQQIKNITRKTIDQLGDQIRLTDVDETTNLEQFCYVDCNNDSPAELKNCRGVVFDGENLVLQAFPYTTEYTTDSSELKDIDVSQYRFFDAYEGALLRIFNHYGKWFLTTHRKLNAFKSRWASKESYGLHFKRALGAEMFRNNNLKAALKRSPNIIQNLYDILNSSKQYMFLVLNNKDNRIVCLPPENPQLYHVGTFVNGKLDLDEKIPISKPTEHKFKNLEELQQYVNNIDYTQLQGVIGFGPNNSQLKVFHPEYSRLFKLRGNEPSVRFRYLQVRLDEKTTDQLYELYPEFSEDFDYYEYALSEIAKFIYHSYVQRYIHKAYVNVPQNEYRVMRMCHEWHCQDRPNNKISLDKVVEIMDQQSPTSLNHMIRRWRLAQQEHQEQTE